MLHRFSFCKLLLLIAVLCCPLSAFGAPFLSVKAYPDGKTFEILGSGVRTLQGLKFEVSYDGKVLRNPRVVQGPVAAGSLWAVNDKSNPIIGACVTPAGLSTDGLLATITFDRIGTASGKVTAIVKEAEGGTNSPSIGDGTATPDTASNKGGSGNPTDTATTVTPTGTGTTFVGGALSMPGDVRAQTENTPEQVPAVEQPPSQEPPATQEPPSEEVQQPVEGVPAEGDMTPPDAGAAEAGQDVVGTQQPQGKFQQQQVTSVVERFRVYQGERTPQQLIDLFQRGNLSFFTQTPAIALSDGTSVVTVTIRGVTGAEAPTFALQGARSVFVKKGGAGEWVVQARPEKNVVRASITMMADGVSQQLPLTVAPPVRVDLTKSGAVGEDDFTLFLKDRGTEQAPAFDLNGDGRRDYVDDYIFTANYIVRGGAVAARSEAPPQKKDAAAQKKDAAPQKKDAPRR